MTDPTVLRGPLDPDNFRVEVGRYGDRWYCDPLPADARWPTTEAAWPSVSTVKKASGADWTFVALKRVVDALDVNPNALAKMEADERYEALKTINKIGLTRAAQRGTNVHTYFERGLNGDELKPWLPGEPGSEYLPAVQAFFNAYKPELVATELVCLNRDLHGMGYGGTGDAIVRINGKTYFVDWKSRAATSKHGAYPEEAAQLGAYAAAQYMVTGDGRAELPHLDGGLIVSVKPDGCRLYPVDLEQAAAHWTALHHWWVARREERAAIGRQLPVKAAVPADPPTPQPVENPVEDSPSEVLDVADPLLHAALVHRVRYLQEHHPEAVTKLAAGWPAGLPTLKAGGHDQGQLVKIQVMLERLELKHDVYRPDEGPDLAPEMLEEVARRLAAFTQPWELALVNQVAEEANAAGHPINLRARPSMRRYLIATGLLDLLETMVDDTPSVVADQVTLVLGVPLDPAVPLGAYIGRLTLEQAARLSPKSSSEQTSNEADQ